MINVNKEITGSQLKRVVSIASKGFYTLQEIQRQIKKEFNEYDQETSISARIRQAANEYGYKKSVIKIKNDKTGREHFKYKLEKVMQ